MEVHLIDGTYELFRQHYGRPEPGPYGAVLGVVRSTLALLSGGATHVAIASDHVIESFRNDLWPGYKTSAGMDPVLLAQISLMEETLAAIGCTIWAEVAHEADDALASAAAVAEQDVRVERVLITTPDKDLGQCVRGTRVVQWDRRNDVIVDEAGVVAKFGVPPASIPDWLALVGDSADGYPGLPGWGAKSAGAVLGRYGHLETIPRLGERWDTDVRGAAKLANTLAGRMDEAVLFRRIATCVSDLPVGDVDAWRWQGPGSELPALAATLGSSRLADQVSMVWERHARD